MIAVARDRGKPTDGRLTDTRSNRWMAGGVLIVGLAITGCADGAIAGAPTAVAGGTVRSSTAPLTKQTLPPRRRGLSLGSVNPCALFPADRRAEFGVSQPMIGPHAYGEPSSCGASSANRGGVSLAADRSRSAAYFLGDKPLSYGSLIAVADYPGVLGYTKADNSRECFGRPDVLCSIAQKVALVALDALKAQKK